MPQHLAAVSTLARDVIAHTHDVCVVLSAKAEGAASKMVLGYQALITFVTEMMKPAP